VEEVASEVVVGDGEAVVVESSDEEDGASVADGAGGGDAVEVEEIS
jgi:hypothetical protein